VENVPNGSAFSRLTFFLCVELGGGARLCLSDRDAGGQLLVGLQPRRYFVRLLSAAGLDAAIDLIIDPVIGDDLVTDRVLVLGEMEIGQIRFG
jgi:hypothetical protein